VGLGEATGHGTAGWGDRERPDERERETEREREMYMYIYIDNIIVEIYTST
jgi:hypothetical protein